MPWPLRMATRAWWSCCSRAEPTRTRRTDDGTTPCCVAVENGHAGVVELLLARGADLNKASTDNGSTPCYAAEHMATRAWWSWCSRTEPTRTRRARMTEPRRATAA